MAAPNNATGYATSFTPVYRTAGYSVNSVAALRARSKISAALLERPLAVTTARSSADAAISKIIVIFMRI
jgi:hypothetical protein